MDPHALAYAATNGMVGLAMLALAVVVVVRGRGVWLKGLLGAVLVIEGVIGVLVAFRYLVEDPFLFANINHQVRVVSLVLCLSYLAFLGEAIPTPAVAWLRWPGTRSVLLALAVLLVAAALAWPLAVRAAIDRWLVGVVVASVAAFLLGTFAAVAQYLASAPGTVSRRQAGAYLVAFILNDLGWGLAFGGLLMPPGGPRDLVQQVLSPLALLLFAAGLVRALLRFQLFEFDLRVKRGLAKSVVAGAFIFIFLVISQMVESLSNQVFGLVGGAIAAGLALFALRPIESTAARVAERAMPGVEDTPAYRRERAREIYRAAFESASRDGALTARERRVLATLQDELGISATEALDLESG